MKYLTDSAEWPEKTAGRPQIIKDGKQTSVYLDAASLDVAKKLGDGNVSAGIRKAILNQPTSKPASSIQLLIQK